MKRFLAGLILIVSLGVAQANDMLVSLDDILLLSQSGVSDQTILVFLKNREIGFIPDAKDIDSLLVAGVSDKVIRYLLEQTANKTSYISAPVTYVDRYPAYYYTPYYTRASLFFGFSSFPHAFSGYHHRGLVHHAEPPLLAHNGHGISHNLHGNKHGVTHAGGHRPGHKTFIAGHNAPRAGHNITGARHGKISDIAHTIPNNRHGKTARAVHNSRSVGHDKTVSAGHSSRSIGHVKTTNITHNSRMGRHGFSGINVHSRSSGIGHKGGFSNGHSRSGGGGHSAGGNSSHSGGH